MRLTDDAVRKAKPPRMGQTFLWGDVVVGFGVRLTPTQRSFVIQLREPDGRKPRETLRPGFPVLSCVKARELARARRSRLYGYGSS